LGSYCTIHTQKAEGGGCRKEERNRDRESNDGKPMVHSSQGTDPVLEAGEIREQGILPNLVLALGGAIQR